jgi:hypothetical protein
VHSTAISLPQQILQFGSSVLSNRRHGRAEHSRNASSIVIGSPIQARILNTATPTSTQSPGISSASHTPPPTGNGQAVQLKPRLGQQYDSTEPMPQEINLQRAIKFQDERPATGSGV